MNTVVVERTYEAPIERVWEALTNKEQMKQWYFDVSDFKPEPGFKFEFTGGDENVQYRHLCEVIEVDKPNKLSYTWQYENIEGVSLVTIELFAEAENRTRVKLTHSGLDFKTDDKNFQPSSFNTGWNSILDASLRNFVEKGSLYKSIVINASLADIWETIVNPNHDWAMAFGGGALAETDWQQGSKIVWTDMEGNIGANGIVEKLEREKLLQLQYYDVLDPNTNEPLGEYREIFRLTPQNGNVLLEVETGKLQKYYLNMHDKMWDDALEGIKKTAESKS
jgi:uncharacterized protein YndB with AHSA1/START domain